MVWKNLPLTMHPNARPAALAAMAAHEQGKFWEYHDKVFGGQPKLAADDLIRYAQELGLDVSSFKDDLAKEKFKPQVDADASEAASLGVTGTPAFFVNGKYLSGAKPYDEFVKVINAELTRLNVPIPAAAAAPPAPAPAGG